MKFIINYGKGNIFTIDPTPVVKQEKDKPLIDMAATIKRVENMVGKDAQIAIA